MLSDSILDLFHQLVSTQNADTSKIQIIEDQIDERLSLVHIENEMISDSSFQDFYQIGMQNSTLNTSYKDIINIFSKLPKTDEIKLLDIGAGHCRFAIVAHFLFPHISVTSIEPVLARTQSAKKVCKGQTFITRTYQHGDSEGHQYAYLYFPTGRVLDSILDDLQQNSKISIIATESHGELINRLALENSFEKKILTQTVIPRHDENIYFFERSKKSAEENILKLTAMKLYAENYLLIGEDGSQWIADLNEVEIHYDKPQELCLELKYPPRTFTLNTANLSKYKVIYTDDIEPEHLNLINRRRNDETIAGEKIRKIYLNGDLELSSGTIINLDEI